ncbi:MAG TPA: 23S rRNA (adenine(2503)-C(2))-methyltransferase RlmN [Candidatus Limnocylindrales bacterium]|nr:23S rRNA (adenine(2503)-C(2))-methyltransferase RlmN [Candidatus Limnocylindrales bacterium]
MKRNIKDLSFSELAAFLAERKHPAYRAQQVWQWLFQKRARRFVEMTNLSRPLREELEREFSISGLTVVRRAESRDGTVKFLFGLADGQSIESVLIPETERLTLCISTQVGCAYGCAFCATALLGLKRNLTVSEIVDQIIEVSRAAGDEQRITNIVLMGMGEPLANYANTLRAIEIMTDGSWGLGIAPRRVTLSSVGLIPQIEKLMAETNVSLAISLHAATEELRGRLMPVNRKYSLQQLIDCCRNLPLPRRKRITFEYVLLRGVNDSAADALSLCRLLRGVPSKVNVIPFNPHPESEFERPADEDVKRFQQVLFDHHIQVNVRRPRGDDIAAACGQLQGQAEGRWRESSAHREAG